MDVLGDSLSLDGTFAPFDLVLSDLRMPGWPGMEALAKVSRNPGMPPFILFTAFADEDTHKRALEIGALTLLDKPFDIDYLLPPFIGATRRTQPIPSKSTVEM
jgi:DNA-binding response OmpR family regulator